MTEEAARAAVESEGEAAAVPALVEDDIAPVIERWFYAGGEFSAALVTRSRHYRAVADVWLKKAGKRPYPLSDIAATLPPEAKTLFDNCVTMHREYTKLAEEAETREAVSAANAAGAGNPRTRSVGVSPVW